MAKLFEIDNEEMVEDTIFLNLERGKKARKSRNSLERGKAQRRARLERKEALRSMEVAPDNGHYFVGNINKRGAMNVSLVEKKRRKEVINFEYFDDSKYDVYTANIEKFEE